MIGKPFSKYHYHFSAFLILLTATIAMFGDVLFSSNEVVLSQYGTDTSHQFLFWRDFGFTQLKEGNLPLWNPHIFSGAPFLGGFQSALLYPPNFIYLILPLAKAINVGIAIHVFLIGFFMYFWAAFRGLHPFACILSALLIMFSGAHFMHIYAGHLTNLCTMAWAPLLLLSIDGLFKNRSIGWCLLGILAVTMQILAGHPQYLYYASITVFIYSALRLVKYDYKACIVLGISGIYIGGFALGAVQILSGFHATHESIRSLGVPFEFASMFSFPPENFLTLLVPHFFGDMMIQPYWGRCYLWEMSLFISISGLALAVYGAAYGNKNVRLFSITMILVLFLLALGIHTPLFNILYHWLPGFDKFRSTSKFIFQASLFMTLLAGIGLDNLINRTSPTKKISILILMAGILLGGVALLIFSSRTNPTLAGMWWQIMHAIGATHESYLPSWAYLDAKFIYQAAHFASIHLFIAAGTCILLSLSFFLASYSKKITYLILFLACIEIFTFAKISLATFDLKAPLIPDLTTFYANHPGDYRVLNPLNPNSAMSTGANDIWGFDPGVLLRYAQFVAFTQGQDPDKVTQYVTFTQHHRLFNMLRCKYAFIPDKDMIRIREFKDVMPRLQLIQEWKLIEDRKHIFAEMGKTSFDPRKTVILEKPPYPEPVKTQNTGYCTIVDSSTDHLTIKTNLPIPSILLITDAYSSGWRARALPGSIQNTYDVQPANYTLMAIPLSAGNHLFRVEYMPLAFCVGKWISIVSITIYFALLLFFWHKHRQKILSRG